MQLAFHMVATGMQVGGRALVTYGCSFYTLSAIRSLGRRGVQVIAGDRHPLTPCELSRYTVASFCYPDPERDPEQFLAGLEEAVRRHAPAGAEPYVLLPMHRETLLIALHRERFEPYIRMLVPDSAALELVDDEDRVRRHARAQGVPVASAGWPGDDPCVLYCVSALFSRGRLCASTTFRRTEHGCTQNSLLGVADGVRTPCLEKWMIAFFGSLGWHGLAHAYFRSDGSHELGAGLLRINPHFSAGLFDVIAAGIDYPWLLYRLSLDADMPALQGPFRARAETPVLCLLGMIGEIADSESALARLETRWRGTGVALVKTDPWQACQRLFRKLRGSCDASVRLNRVQKLLRENQGAIKEILDDEDPVPALAILYELAHFVRHGRLEPAFPGGEGMNAASGRREHGARDSR
jgi:hypothetical protein